MRFVTAGKMRQDGKEGIGDMGNAGYKISVIVPVYNKKQYLNQCIDSILAQTYRNLELVLVDDESSDGSGEICDRYAGEDERVRVFHQKNGGSTAAVLTGMKEAEGEYFVFIDSDDYVSREMLEEMAGHLLGRKGEIVCCNYMLEKQKETIPVMQGLAPGIYEGERLEREVKDMLLGNENRKISMSRCMKLCERSVFDGNEKYYDTKIRMGDDFNLMFPALLNCSRIVVMEGALFYHYRYVGDSIAHGYDPRMEESVDRWYRCALRTVRDKGMAEGEEKLVREYVYMMILVMKNELRNPDKNYIRKIRDIFTKPEVREKIDAAPLHVEDRANRLIYMGVKHPDRFRLGILRMIMKQYDRAR